MKWAHLPNAGGIYDQSPALLDDWSIIFQKQGEARQREADKQDRELAEAKAKAKNR